MASIQGIYIALFGRPADPLGLDFFNEATGNGADLTAIGDLAATAEYQSRFEGMDNAAIVTEIYNSLFGRNPEQAGLAFFVNALNAGTLNINNVAIAILDGAQGDDLATVNNKIAAAEAFTAAIDTPDELAAYRGDAAAAAGRDFLDGITADEATIPTADQVAAAIAAIQGGGDTFTLTEDIDAPGISGPGADTTGTSGDDTYFANSRTLNPGDVIDGREGNNSIELSLGGSAFLADDTNDSLTATNIQTVQVTAVPTSILGFPLGDVALDMLEAIGVTTLSNFNSSTDLFVENVQNNLAIEIDNVGDLDGFLEFDVEFDSDALGSEDAVLDVSVTDSAVLLGLYTNGDDSVETVNFTVEDDNFVTLDLTAATEDELTTLTAAGEGFLDVVDFDAEFENVATVDFSALEGGSYLDLSTNETDVAYSGGAGIDFVGFGDGEFDENDTVDGGAESDFLGVDLDDAALIGGANITDIENVVLGGTLEGDVTIEDVEDLGFESISIAGTADVGTTLTIEEADGVVINYLGDSLFATSDGSDDVNEFNGTIEFDSTDDVTFIVGVAEGDEGQPTTGLEFFNDKFQGDFDDADSDLFIVNEFILDEVETIDLSLNGDFIVDNATISDVAFDDILETFTISGEGDFILNGGTDSFDGTTFDLTALTGGFSNEGVGAGGSQEFILGDLGSADGAFENDNGLGGEFLTYDFEAADEDADAVNDADDFASVIALGGANPTLTLDDAGTPADTTDDFISATAGGDNARDIVTFTTGDFGNIAIEGFQISEPGAITDDVLDFSALVGNVGADIDFADNEAGTGVLISSEDFSGTVLLVGVTEAQLNALSDFTSIFGA